MPTTINPYTSKPVTKYAYDSTGVVTDKITHLHAGFMKWKKYTYQERAKILRQIAKGLRDRAEECAQMMTAEMGKPITQARAEIEKSALACEYFAIHAHTMLSPEPVLTEYQKTYIRHDPLGIIFTITPWNFPFWMLFRTGAASLMAGNTLLFKGASNVAGCNALIAEICHQASPSLPLLEHISIETSQVEDIIRQPEVSAIALTGSEAAGRSVATIAGKYLKKCVLELGGSDPFIVLADADLDTAAAIAASARCSNAGQICISPKRYIVLDTIYDVFVARLTEAVSKIKVGDPMLDTTQTGPLAKASFVTDLQKQIDESVQQGAKVAYRHPASIAGSGAFFPPTILTHIKRGIPAYSDELFGPVFSLIKVSSVAEAVDIANDTEFGLGANIWTQDVALAEQIAIQLDVGSVAINDVVKSDPRYPLGGTKASGYGRELGTAGIKEWVNAKSIVVK